MENKEEMDCLFIHEEEQGERLDKVLSSRFGERHSRTYFQYLIAEGLVLVNGEAAKKRVKLQVNDEVEIHFVATPQIDVQPEAISLDLLHEDEDLLVINKPKGMVVHPAPGNWTGTFVNALLHHCRGSLSPDDQLRPGIVHRLDKDTSGVLIAAKNVIAHQRLIALFATRQMHKEYLAICLGNPGKVEVSAPIGRHPINRKLMAVLPEKGRSAVSRFSTLASNEKLSVVRVVPETGRTHQIRVHLKHLGTPVLGDSAYGNAQANKKYDAPRHLLHAELLSFVHPMTGKLMKFQAPIPEDIQTFIRTISSKKN